MILSHILVLGGDSKVVTRAVAGLTQRVRDVLNASDKPGVKKEETTNAVECVEEYRKVSHCPPLWVVFSMLLTSVVQ